MTFEMRNVSAMGLRDVKYTSGPFITLVDGPEFDDLWEKRRPLILGQLADADMVAVSRCDLIDAAEARRIKTVLQEHTERMVLLSAAESRGVAEVMQMLNLHS